MRLGPKIGNAVVSKWAEISMFVWVFPHKLIHPKVTLNKHPLIGNIFAESVCLYGEH